MCPIGSPSILTANMEAIMANKIWFYLTAQDEADSHFDYHIKKIEGEKLQAYVDERLAKVADAVVVRAYRIPSRSLKPDFFTVCAVSKRPF